MIALTKAETVRLRDLHFRLLEAKQDLQAEANRIAEAHGVDLAKEKADLTPDFRFLVKS